MFTIALLSLIALLLGTAYWRLRRASPHPAPSAAMLASHLDAMEGELNKTERHFRQRAREERREAKRMASLASPVIDEKTPPPKTSRPAAKQGPPKDEHGAPYPKMSKSMLSKFIEYRKTLDARLNSAPKPHLASEPQLALPPSSPLALRQIAPADQPQHKDLPINSSKPPTLLARCATLLSYTARRIFHLTRTLAALFSRPKPPPLLPASRNP